MSETVLRISEDLYFKTEGAKIALHKKDTIVYEFNTLNESDAITLIAIIQTAWTYGKSEGIQEALDAMRGLGKKING